MVPPAGLEPAHLRRYQHPKLARLPFRHGGTVASLQMIPLTSMGDQS